MLDSFQVTKTQIINHKTYLKLDSFSQHHFVEGPNEESVEKFAVIDCHAGHAADELKSI